MRSAVRLSEHARAAKRIAVLSLLMAVVAACGGGGRDFSPVQSMAQAAARGPYAVGVVTLTLTDTSRPTAANRDVPGSDQRVLQVEVWYPAQGAPGEAELRDAPLAAGDAPYPLVVISHGFSASRRLYTSYGIHLASHGFVAAAPDFPLTNLTTAGGPRFGDLVNQPGDVSFVIDELLALSAGAEPPLAGAIDGERIGATGHSLGGATTFLLTYGALADARIDAAVPVASAGCAERSFFSGGARPLMVIEGQQDLFVAGARDMYERAPAPKYLVSIRGAGHIPFADADIPDEVGLAALTSAVAGRAQETAADFERLSETGLFIGGCVQEGVGDRAVDRSVPLIEGSRQRELMDLYATLFFSATLREDKDALRVLRGESEPHPQEVEFEFEEP